MIYTAYLIISPKEPLRACVSAFPPSPERRRALEAQGCEIYQANIEVPTKLAETYTQVEATAEQVYVGRRVVTGTNLRGVVVRSQTAGCIQVRWDHSASEGTFVKSDFESRLKSGWLKWES